MIAEIPIHLIEFRRNLTSINRKDLSYYTRTLYILSWWVKACTNTCLQACFACRSI